jgi:hypothetical protein
MLRQSQQLLLKLVKCLQLTLFRHVSQHEMQDAVVVFQVRSNQLRKTKQIRSQQQQLVVDVVAVFLELLKIQVKVHVVVVEHAVAVVEQGNEGTRCPFQCCG